MNIPTLIVFGILTAAATGAALALAPPEKRLGFGFHIAIVTVLTAIIVAVD